MTADGGEAFSGPSGGWRPPTGPGSSTTRTGSIEGVVRGFAVRTEQDPFHGVGGGPRPVWTFTLETFDADGNRLPPVPVQMSGYGFDGAVRDGDHVLISASEPAGTTLRPHEIRNVTTGVVVRARRAVPAWFWIVAAVLLLMLLVVIGYNVWAFTRPVGPPEGFPARPSAQPWPSTPGLPLPEPAR